MIILPYRAGDLAHLFNGWVEPNRRYTHVVILDDPRERRFYAARKFGIAMWLADNILGHYSCDATWGPVFFFSRADAVGKFVQYMQCRLL